MNSRAVKVVQNLAKELSYGLVATRFSHRLPGTTDDILRKLRDPHGDLRLVVSLQELRELLAMWVWNYNGTPHGGLAVRAHRSRS